MTEIGDIRINENGAEQQYVAGIKITGEETEEDLQPRWIDSLRQRQSQKWVWECTDCGRKETTVVHVRSDEWFTIVAESKHKKPITYIKECEQCLDDIYGKDEE